MAHYALINSDNIVTQVITGIDESNTETLPSEFSSWEEFYGSIHNCTCKRTSYNTKKNVHLEGGTPFRGNYAGIGYTYDADNDVFLPVKPYESWTLNTDTWAWEAPIADPSVPNESNYSWDESAYQADNTQGWVEQ